jgi:hypothetical protein
LLAHGNESRAKSQRDDGAQEESARVEADNDIDLLGRRRGAGVGCDVVDKVRYEGLKSDGIPEDRENVQENDALFDASISWQRDKRCS